MKTETIRFLTRSLAIALLSSTVAISAWADAFRTVGGGVKLRDQKLGAGPVAEAGQVAAIHVIGWMDDNGAQGRQLYNTRNRGEPISFVIGTDKVMPAFNEGVLGMQKGGRRMLLVPPGMAYGDRQIDGVVPANASLMLQIELVDLRESQ